MSTTTTSASILCHTSAFLSQTLSQPQLRRQLFSTFLSKLPRSLIKPLKFTSQTIENSISTGRSSSSSSLRLVEKLLTSYKNNHPFSLFLLSLIYHLTNREIDASISLLNLFYSDPSLTRLEICPYLFQELFFIHFQPLIEWYDERRSLILPFLLRNAGYDSDGDDRSFVSATTKTMSRISGDQASGLKDLEREYEDLLDQNCRIFVEYFKELLLNRDREELVVPPLIALTKQSDEDNIKVVFGHEVLKINSQEFQATNRRYNPIWTEGDASVESNSNISKSLSKFPSFVPERVSPNVLTNQRSSQNSEPSPINHRTNFDDKTRSSYDNLTDCSSSDYEPEHEEKMEQMALFDFRKSQLMKKKLPLLAEDSSYSSSDSFMAEADSSPGGGKLTPPKDFVCPITTHIFDDPVTLETGQTYERIAIQEWIDRGNSTCPITRQTLQSTHLPKTNYVLKRLIASWQEKNRGSVVKQSEVMLIEDVPKSKPPVFSVSPNSVISQAASDGTMSELRLAISDLCTSEILREAEMAVLKIDRFWKEADIELEMKAMLSKPPVINCFVEILFHSVDTQVLRATILLLIELGSRNEDVIQTLTRVDSDVECLIDLFKKGLSEAVVLVYLLRPSPASLVQMDIVDYLLVVIGETEDDVFPKLCVKPKTASLILLRDILRNASEETLSVIVRNIVSKKRIDSIVASLRAEEINERIAAVSILLRCIMEDGKCRNIVADKADLALVLESFVGVNDGEQFEIVHFLFELVKLNRRSLNLQILHMLKDEGAFSSKHTLLVYLQHAHHDQSPIIAGLLLQLDLLNEPRKMSIYREESIDALILCLRNSESPVAQISAADTLLSLQGSFSYSGRSLARAILLKRAGLNRSYNTFMQKDQRRQNISADALDTMDDEKASEEWERKVAFVLVSHEFGLIFEALAEGLNSRYEELRSVCFMTATWLVHMLSSLPDTGLKGAARLCLLKHFVAVFKSEENIEERALSMLALNTFIHDTDALQDLTPHMKEIRKGLRELKKSSKLAFDILRVFSEEHDSSTDIWNHKELSQEDCSINGEVLAVTCFKDNIFSGHSDGTIKVWRNGGSKLHLIQEVREHVKAVTSLSIVHSSEKLYSGSLDRTLRVWSFTEEGIYCEQVQETKDQTNSLVVANNIACYIPQGAGVKVHSWNGSSKSINQHKYVKCLSLVQGKLYCGCQDNSIQEIDLATGTTGNIQIGSKKLLGKSYPIYALQVHDGLIYAAGQSYDGANVKIWSTSNYGLVGSLQTTLDVRTLAVSLELIYLGCKGGAIEIWCKKKYNRIETLQPITTGKILCMALDTNEDVLVIGTSDGKIQIWGLS